MLSPPRPAGSRGRIQHRDIRVVLRALINLHQNYNEPRSAIMVHAQLAVYRDHKKEFCQESATSKKHSSSSSGNPRERPIARELTPLQLALQLLRQDKAVLQSREEPSY